VLDCDFEDPENTLSDLFGAHLSLFQCLIFMDNENDETEPSINQIASMVSLTKLKFRDNDLNISNPMILPHSLIKCRIGWPPHFTPDQALEFIRTRAENGGPLRGLKIISPSNDHEDSEWRSIEAAAQGLGVSFSFARVPSFSIARNEVYSDVAHPEGGALDA
jgi:hypothetical protein